MFLFANFLLFQDYYDKIKKPMDMSTIKKKLTSKMYASSEECIADFQQMFSNCHVYNGNTDVSINNFLFQLYGNFALSV